MQGFANQCADLAQVILGHTLPNLGKGADGGIVGAEGPLGQEELACLVWALAQYHRLGKKSEADLAWPGGNSGGWIETVVSALESYLQKKTDADSVAAPGGAESRLCLGLMVLAGGQEWPQIKARLSQDAQQRLESTLVQASEIPHNATQASGELAKAGARLALGIQQKEAVSSHLRFFLDYLKQHSDTGTPGAYGVVDAAALGAPSGVFDASGLARLMEVCRLIGLSPQPELSQRHALALRTCADAYLRLLPHLIRQDGLSWAYGAEAGVHGQLYSIDLLLHALGQGWVAQDKLPVYHSLLRRLFQYFFTTYVDLEHGSLVVRDAERGLPQSYSLVRVNLEAVAHLSHWALMAREIKGPDFVQGLPDRSSARFVLFHRGSGGREQGVFIYKNSQTGLQVQLPLVNEAHPGSSSDSLAFPHCPGVFDWPVGRFMPVMLPALEFEFGTVVPAFYGKGCAVRTAPRDGFCFVYEQPDWVDVRGLLRPGLGQSKVSWTFDAAGIVAQFSFQVKSPQTLRSLQYCVPVASLHSVHRSPKTLMHGPDGLQVEVVKDDFHCHWVEPQVVSEDPNYQTYYGKIHYIQKLERTEPLLLQPGRTYNLGIRLQPQLTYV